MNDFKECCIGIYPLNRENLYLDLYLEGQLIFSKGDKVIQCGKYSISKNRVGTAEYLPKNSFL